MTETGNSSFAQQLLHSDTIIMLYFVQLMLYFIAAVSCSYLIYLINKIYVFHENLRMLLTNLAVVFIMISIQQYFAGPLGDIWGITRII